ncbi:hypothetical protein RHMOL_Rhmol08G0316100 [Rhododendron molle]|uniref:Uncharacterized protein n=1 Tax=Rhododendron molle TaxID=49168 RepID=A0ACC0MUI8_RHOML|nr:hypothetical protein RHMOL_Rhmol08G0316100 [Rhododendron molle]
MFYKFCTACEIHTHAWGTNYECHNSHKGKVWRSQLHARKADPKKRLKTGLKKPKARKLSSLAKDYVQISHGRRQTAYEVASILDLLVEKISLKRSFTERLKAIRHHDNPNNYATSIT